MSQKGLWDNQPGGQKPGVTEPLTSKLGRSGQVQPGVPAGTGGIRHVPPGAPLALRMTPLDFDEYLGQEELMGSGKPLRRMVEGDKLISMIFWGPPGTGKTALARLIASKTLSYFKELSAVASGVQDVRKVVSFALEARKAGRKTILFLDEIHRFTKAQQDVLLPYVENGTLILIGATTENPYFSVNSALLSRMRIFRFEHLSPSQIRTLLERAISDPARGLLFGDMQSEAEGQPEDTHVLEGEEAPIASGWHESWLTIEDKVIDHIVAYSKGDGRTALNVLEALYYASNAVDGKKVLALEKAMEITQSPVGLYDKTGDWHYDIISAYIKSMRGSDPDAALYWLARMVHSGEDPRYIARRLVICASEDVGMADPMALVLAESAFRASEHLGMPEARIPLAQATVYVALAPKSNSAYLAIDRALQDVKEKPAYPVPLHLRGTGYQGARKLGHGDGYLYPHDYPGHHVEQQYLPGQIKDAKYYKPSENDKSPGLPGRTN
ncbi:MAG TPA: replication-associated recombination protein A [Firmicutes bacterium]|nr:replication-associated recombination protein A [Candidatus Fermentithermobacillaceae bacterium]